MDQNKTVNDKLIKDGIRKVRRLTENKSCGLARSWRALHESSSNRELVNRLEQRVGQKFPPNRISEWRNGRRRVPAIVQREMRRDLLGFILESSPSTIDQLQQLIEPAPLQHDSP